MSTGSPITAPSGTSAQPSLAEKIAYGLGDTACNLVWALTFNFALYFYTDVFGIPAAVAGTMLLATRAIDSGWDLLVGWLADRTDTRWGTFRPYLLFGGIPLAVTFAVAFMTPAGGVGTRIAYACLTHGLLMLAYSVVNIPYGALSAAMTDDPDERLELNVWRMLGGQAGAMIVGTSFLPLITHFGGGDEAVGASRTVLLYAAGVAILLMVTSLCTRERVAPPRHRGQPTGWSAFASHNPNWLLLLGTGAAAMTLLVLRGSTAVYYLQHVLGWGDDLIAWWFVVAGLAGGLGTVLTRPAVHLVGRRWAMITSIAVMAAGTAPLFWLPSRSLAAILSLHALAIAASGLHCALYWTLLADTVDFAEWSSGVRPTGFMFSAGTCAQKLGVGIGAAIGGSALSLAGYVPEGPQSPPTTACILLLMSLVPAAGYALLAAVFSRYSLDDRRCRTVRADLAARRRLP
jgi:glycoside/pentoside/hexuronide:cation symporter, GPH family